MISWNHIQGHQDGKTTMVLPRDAWLNIKAHVLAKAMLETFEQGPTNFRLPFGVWVCYIS